MEATMPANEANPVALSDFVNSLTAGIRMAAPPNVIAGRTEVKSIISDHP
jgi:hypothetical protein